MADTKISALPAGGAAIGADQYVVARGGVNVRVDHTAIIAAPTADVVAHAALTVAGTHGSATATGANTLVHRDAAGDADATAFNAAAGAAGTPSHTFTADPNTGHYNYAADELGVATGGAHRAHWNTTGAVILNDAAASSKMTGPGVTIQQGAFDDEAVAIKSTDVAHGMTVLADTDTYFQVTKREAAAGGVSLQGFKDADGFAGAAILLAGFLGENADTTKTTAGRAIVEVVGVIKSGTGIGDTNADGNVFGVRTYRGGAEVTLLLVDEDADLHVLNDIVVAGAVDTIDVANHVHTGAAGHAPQLTAAGITDRTRTFFVPVVGGFDATAPTSDLTTFSHIGIECIDNQESRAFGYGIVPNDFASGMTVTSVIVPNANGNCYGQTMVRYGQCNDFYADHIDDSGIMSAVAVTQDANNCIHQVTLANEAIGDILRCSYTRDAVNALDTINNIAHVAGFIVEYTADS